MDTCFKQAWSLKGFYTKYSLRMEIMVWYDENNNRYENMNTFYKYAFLRFLWVVYALFCKCKQGQKLLLL